MPDFSSLLRKPLADVKRPKALPVGDYPARIREYKLDESKEKKTPYVRFTLSLLGPPANASQGDLDALGETDLSKRQIHKDYYLTPDADWRLKEMLEALGVEATTFEEALPRTIGRPCVAAVTQRIDTNPQSANYNETFNDVAKIVGA